MPEDAAFRTTPRIAAFRPGQSPPPVKMPILRAIGSAYPTGGRPASRPRRVRYSGNVLAAWGLLEWFFAGLLAFLVGLVGLFFLFLIVQLFLNPSRHPRRL